jgi:GAF domain-containing protein
MLSPNDIDLSAELARRPSRAPDFEAEARLMVQLGDELGDPNGDVLASLTRAAISACRADASGISLLEPHGAEEVFRWVAIRGTWSRYEGGGLPRSASPCGVTIARNQAVLMRAPHLAYPEVRGSPEIAEVLLAPFTMLGQPVGTVWVITHDPARKFDAEDARMVGQLARFAGKAFLLVEQLKNALANSDELSRANVRLKRELERAR